MNIFHRPSRSAIASPASFRESYERHRLSVFRYIYALTGGSQEDAEDLTAEAFLRAWKSRHQFEGDAEKAIGWLLRIARSLVIDDYRRTARATRHLPTDPESEPTPEQITIHDEQRRFLFALLTDLPDEQREMVILRYQLGWRVNEIAQHLGTSENNVSVSLHRTLAKLREKWTEMDADHLSTIFTQKEETYESHT